MSSSSRIKGAIIGCGYFGQIHLGAWRAIPEVELIAACDLNLERAKTAAPHAYSNAEEMLDRESVDFVDIASPVASHLELVRLCSARGLPTSCQKPMAPSWNDAVAIVEAAEAAGIFLMIHENWRWQPWYRKAKEIIERGDIGHPLGYWFRTRCRDGIGPDPYPKQSYFRRLRRFLIDETLVHYIDTARFLFGDIATIYAEARQVNSAIVGEDQAILVLRHTNELIGTVDGHRFLNPEPDGPAVGEAGFEGEDGSIRILATGDIWHGNERVWENRVVEGYRGDSVRATLRHFLDCLKNGTTCESGARNYLKTFAAVEAAYRSIAEKRAIPLSDPQFAIGAST